MQPFRLPGGHRAPATGSYQEVHSGHIVYVTGHGVLPGSPNSDTYVAIGERPGVQLPRIRSEQG